MRYVWQLRLARCHRNLTDPAMRDQSITELAMAAGFNDLSHFSRKYRNRYGCPPGILGVNAWEPECGGPSEPVPRSCMKA